MGSIRGGVRLARGEFPGVGADGCVRVGAPWRQQRDLPSVASRRTRRPGLCCEAIASPWPDGAVQIVNALPPEQAEALIAHPQVSVRSSRTARPRPADVSSRSFECRVCGRRAASSVYPRGIGERPGDRSCGSRSGERCDGDRDRGVHERRAAVHVCEAHHRRVADLAGLSAAAGCSGRAAAPR